ncbi:MAG: adenylate/guanylate cyclase domain-containing protein [Armatimonadetes bacterium]|nr:adenylate/guanylate cyclase domain-containing protein [Armatimonadota bacterium]
MLRPKTSYALSGDVNIAYQVIGDGPHDLVMAPGTMSHLDLDWENPTRVALNQKLSEYCRVIRFDKRGTGLSDRPLKVATLEERTDDIRAVLDAVGLEKAHIFGGSEGGSMACMFAATYPNRTLSLIVWGAQAKWIRSEDHPWGQTPEEHEDMLRMIQESWPSEEYIRGPGAGFGQDADPAVIEAVGRYMQAAASPSVVLAYERMNAEIDTRGILPFIHVPTLVMNREGDPVAHVEAARDMASRIPGAIFKAYPGNTHTMASGDSDEVVNDLIEFITGERPAPSSDRILASVLFLDIASSTERAAALGDSTWKQVMNSYYAIVRKELQRFRGHETNTAGDGFLATFDGPARAVRCGLAIASAVKTLGIDVRAGVHTGECEVMGDNVGGIAIHIGARVMATAEPGSVMASSTVKDLVSGSGIEFIDAGRHELKGVPDKWHLYCVRG